MLSPRRGQGDTVAAARTRGRIWGTGEGGVNRWEGGVTGHTCERWVVGWLGGLWRPWVREREVTVGRVVMRVGRQDRCRMVVVVVMMEWRA